VQSEAASIMFSVKPPLVFVNLIGDSINFRFLIDVLYLMMVDLSDQEGGVLAKSDICFLHLKSCSF
jgi:hypothetical protein